VFTALVVPRVTSSRSVRTLAKLIGGTARHIVPRLPNYETRDRLMSLIGPAAMIILFVLWSAPSCSGSG
jgi:hypothetical protein